MSATQNKPADADVRERALDPSRSFIVQAPAGSGKTELLIQRYLRLLAIVDEPEQVLAITFTRKATAEMRDRVNKALRAARSGDEPGEEHLHLGYRLARAVVARDESRGWDLAGHPVRLRIGTIDSINSRIGRRAPLSTGVTSANILLEDTGPLYREVARRTIAFGQDDGELGAAVRLLLAHCDNVTDRLETLLRMMLERRDQWLRKIGTGQIEDPEALRAWLEATLGELIESQLHNVGDKIPCELVCDLITLLQNSASGLIENKPDAAIIAWADQQELPALTIENLSLWRAAADTLLTKNGTWRKRVDKNSGFPPARKDEKQQALKVLEKLSAYPHFETALARVKILPDPHYSDAQWNVLAALFPVLPAMVAVLKQLFAERGQTDFTEIAQEALNSVGSDENMTELGLALDYQIQHILVDEFQDTSRSQYDLIRRFTAGWENDSGRSLFLVGDPMQSIYRFREAEVGLFIQTQDQGIGNLKIEPLILKTNFRSDKVIVDWFNDLFSQIMGEGSDALTGAVQFESSVPWRDTSTGAGVYWDVVEHGQRDVEAAKIAALVRGVLERHREETVGILVRSRSHAREVCNALRAAKINYTAADLENMDDQQVVQDLVALTRAVTHLGDRLAWLACLRAPWTGLTLADLHTLAADGHESCLWQSITDPAICGRLSDDGQIRLAAFRRIMAAGLQRRGAIGLRELVEGTWVRLKGPQTISDSADQDLAGRYFSLLGTLEKGGDCFDGAELLQRLADKSITRGSGDAQVQVMTMHKAKGLEFDTVILPCLGYRTRTSQKPALLFHELPRTDGEEPLVVAPIKPTIDKSEPLYDLLWCFEKQQEIYEQQRLLYVAVTRARRRLHLFAQLQRDGKKPDCIAQPDSTTLLSRLWPTMPCEFTADALGVLPDPVVKPPAWEQEPEWFEVENRRLREVADPELPVPGVVEIDATEAVEYEWASQWAKHVGTVVHRWLQAIATDGEDRYNDDEIDRQRPAMRRKLRQLGVEQRMLQKAEDRVADALKKTLRDQKGRWILSNQHENSDVEMPMTVAGPHDFEQSVIDRTFVCKDGIRWIIDYKTSSHEGGDIQSFLASEAIRYRPQLTRYRDALRASEDREMRMALYFPLLQIFHLVDCDQLQ